MDTIEYSEIARDMRRVLEHEREKMVDKLQQVDEFLQFADQMDALISKVKSLQQEVEEQNNKIDELQQQLDEQQQQLDEKNLQLTEFSKLSAGVAKKSSQEELLKALRTYINISKRKMLSKRITVKTIIMEFASSIGLSFPEDMANTLNSLDDDTETVAPVTVNVAAGGINIDTNFGPNIEYNGGTLALTDGGE